MWWSSRRPRPFDVESGPSILKALAVGALALGVGLSAVILFAMVVLWIARIGPTDG
jgi:hypothetical protein